MCSATGRGTTRDSRDYYATPWPAFAPLLKILPMSGVTYFDPCAGDGRLVRFIREAGGTAHGADLFPQPQESYPQRPADYLTDTRHHPFPITNPPFSIAFEMCRHARLFSPELMFLLRLSFLESEERGDWLSENEPSAGFVLKRRPSFVMSVTCKSDVAEELFNVVQHRICKNNWLLPVESERPKVCPKCGGSKLAISTSDNSGYAWFYWGDRFKGIHHI